MDQNPTKDPRPTANLRIKFRSDNLTQFIERYAMDVSRGGIFIRTRDPLAVGTSLKLDFQYQSGGVLLAGEGTVVWVREVDPNRSTVPPGMGVRFDKLSADSQSALDQILVEKAKREGTTAPGVPRMTKAGMPAARPPGPVPAAEATPVAARQPGQAAATPSSAVVGGDPTPSALIGPPQTSAAPVVGASASSASEPAAAASLDEADDLDEEPTQIAPGLPSFMTQGGGGAGRAETDVAKRLPGMAAAASLPAGGDANIGPGMTPVSNGSAKTHPGAAHTEAAIGAGAADGARAARAGTEIDKPKAEPAGPKASGNTPTSGVPAIRAPAGDLEPGLAAVFASKPKATEAELELAKGISGSNPTSPGTPSPAGKSAGAKVGEVPEPPSAARARGLRVPGPVILVSVLVLAAAGFFLVKFFASEATETSTAEQRATASPSVVGPQPGAAAVPVAAPVVPAATVPVAAAPPPPAASTTAAPVDSVAAEKPVAPTEPGATKAVPEVEAAPSGGGSPKAAEIPPPAPPTPAASATAPHAGKDSGSGKSPTNAPVKRRSPRAAAPSAVAVAETPSSGEADATLPSTSGTLMPTIYQLKITSKPVGAEVSIDGDLVGKTPYAGTLPDLATPHVIAIKKGGFEPFEQTVTSTSAWTKSKATRGVPLLQQLKLSPKLRSLTAAGEGKSAGVGAGNDTAAKPEKPDDNTLPPSEPVVPADGTQ